MSRIKAGHYSDGFFKFLFNKPLKAALLVSVVFLLVTPAEISPVYLEYFFFFTTVLFSVAALGKIKGLQNFYSSFLIFLFFIFIIAASHVKSVFLGLSLSFNDFSEYLKFSFPVFIALGVYSVCQKGGLYAISIFLRFAFFVYAIFFLLYMILGVDFIYSLGLGRGPSGYYRFGGLDHNPNAYAAISVAMIFLLFSLMKKSFFDISLMLLLILSLVFSQSRTNLFAFFGVLFLGFFLSANNFLHKLLSFLCVGFLIFGSIVFFDLYWLMAPGRFDVLNDNSFMTRVENSFHNFELHGSEVFLLGIGPAKSVVDRLDTISYIIYMIRYGILGLLAFVFIHVSLSISFLKVYNKFKGSNCEKFFVKILFVNFLFPVYVLIANVSNEKWIDLKFLTLWFFMVGLGMFSVLALRERCKELK